MRDLLGFSASHDSRLQSILSIQVTLVIAISQNDFSILQKFSRNKLSLRATRAPFYAQLFTHLTSLYKRDFHGGSELCKQLRMKTQFNSKHHEVIVDKCKQEHTAKM